MKVVRTLYLPEGAHLSHVRVDRIVTAKSARKALKGDFISDEHADWAIPRAFSSESLHKRLGMTNDSMEDVVWCVHLPQSDRKKPYLSSYEREEREQKLAHQPQTVKEPTQLVFAHHGMVMNGFYVESRTALYASAAIVVEVPAFAPRMRMLQQLHVASPRFRDAFAFCAVGVDPKITIQEMKARAEALQTPCQVKSRKPWRERKGSVVLNARFESIFGDKWGANKKMGANNFFDDNIFGMFGLGRDWFW